MCSRIQGKADPSVEGVVEGVGEWEENDMVGQ